MWEGQEITYGNRTTKVLCDIASSTEKVLQILGSVAARATDNQIIKAKVAPGSSELSLQTSVVVEEIRGRVSRWICFVGEELGGGEAATASCELGIVAETSMLVNCTLYKD